LEQRVVAVAFQGAFYHVQALLDDQPVILASGVGCRALAVQVERVVRDRLTPAVEANLDRDTVHDTGGSMFGQELHQGGALVRRQNGYQGLTTPLDDVSLPFVGHFAQHVGQPVARLSRAEGDTVHGLPLRGV
jgi:hypothetical protein